MQDLLKKGNNPTWSSPKLATANTQTLQATVQPDLKALLGINEAPDFVDHTHWPKAIPQYTLGYGKILETIKLIENQHRGLRLLGNYRNGISLTNCIESRVIFADYRHLHNYERPHRFLLLITLK